MLESGLSVALRGLGQVTCLLCFRFPFQRNKHDGPCRPVGGRVPGRTVIAAPPWKCQHCPPAVPCEDLGGRPRLGVGCTCREPRGGHSCGFPST